MDFYQIWYRKFPRGLNQLCRFFLSIGSGLQGYWFCGRFAYPHRNWKSPLTLSVHIVIPVILVFPEFFITARRRPKTAESEFSLQKWTFWAPLANNTAKMSVDEDLVIIRPAVAEQSRQKKNKRLCCRREAARCFVFVCCQLQHTYSAAFYY